MKLPFSRRPLALAVLSSLIFSLPVAHAEEAPKVALVLSLIHI